MKDYKEMTESVLQQANARAAQRTRQRRMATGLIAATLCFAILIAVVGFGVGRNPAGTTQPTISMDNPTIAPTTQPETTEPTVTPTEAKIYFLSHSESKVSQTQFLKDITIPVDGIIRVRRFDSLSEAERKQVIAEEEAIIEAYQAENIDYPSGVASVYTDMNAVVSMVCKGSITLEFVDEDQYESVDIETTGVGGVSGASVSFFKTATYGEGENRITFPAGTMLYVINWKLSYETKLKLINSPDMALSTIRDTITITVNFTNGDKQIVVVDVAVDDAGQIYMTQRSNNIGV